MCCATPARSSRLVLGTADSSHGGPYSRVRVRISAAGKPRPRCRKKKKWWADACFLQDVAGEVGVLDQFAEVLVDVGAVDDHVVAVAVGGLVAQGVEQAFEHGVQATGADVLLAFVDLGGDVGEAFDRIGRELQCHAFGTQQLDVLRSEEHTSELQSLMRISYAVFCLKKKNTRYRI